MASTGDLAGDRCRPRAQPSPRAPFGDDSVAAKDIVGSEPPTYVAPSKSEDGGLAAA
jgi:hypothetical protein